MMLDNSGYGEGRNKKQSHNRSYYDRTCSLCIFSWNSTNSQTSNRSAIFYGRQASANETATSTNISDPSVSPLQSTTPSLASPPSSSSTTNDESDVSSDDGDSITGNSGDDDFIQEDETIEQNTGNNNDFFEDNDESESSDEDIGDLFE